jgi:oxygen-independent coproporphyrinogen-3 oxidase
MIIQLIGHDFHFELQNICRLFLPQEKLVAVYDETETDDEAVVTARLEKETAETILSCRLHLQDFDEQLTATLSNAHRDYRDECELILCELLYRLLSRAFSVTQAWGLVTGVRPVKLLRRLMAEQGEDEALRWMRERLLVSEKKLTLCYDTLQVENRLLDLSQPESFSLYVSIPLCPTRCDYCSFVSQTVTRAASLMPTYTENLAKELIYTAAIAKELGLKLETVYFGGGTPTTLSA